MRDIFGAVAPQAIELLPVRLHARLRVQPQGGAEAELVHAFSTDRLTLFWVAARRSGS